MSELKDLVADAVVGNDVTDFLVLAAHPDERMLPGSRKPSPTRRTLILECDGRVARYRSSVPDPLIRAWSSPTGRSYAAPARGNYVYVWYMSTWRREAFAAADEQITAIWGLTDKAGDDLVLLCTWSGLYFRRAGIWSLEPLPAPARKALGVHGLAADDLTVCSDEGLLRWDGQAFEEVESPPGPTADCILVRADEIVCGGNILTCWTEALGWHRGEPPLADVMALAETAGQLLIGTYEHGIFEGSCTEPVQVTGDFKCLAIQRLGDGAFARDKHQGWLRRAGEWRPLAMPRAAAGGVPIDPD